MNRKLVTAILMGLIFFGSLVLSAPSASAAPVVTAAGDCYIVPPRGLPQPCGEPALSNANMRDIGIVGTGCAIGAAQAGWIGCGWGSLSAWAGILWNGVAKDE